MRSVPNNNEHKAYRVLVAELMPSNPASGALKWHCSLVVTESTTYEELRAVMLRFDSAYIKWSDPLPRSSELKGNGLSPMELDRVKGTHKGDHKGGKGKGKRKV